MKYFVFETLNQLNKLHIGYTQLSTYIQQIATVVNYTEYVNYNYIILISVKYNNNIFR